MNRPKHLKLILLIIAIAVSTPLLWYWFTVGRAPSVSALEAIQMVRQQNATLLALEELPPVIPAAEQMHLNDLLAAHSLGDLPSIPPNKPLLVICSGGIHSARAASHLKRIGLTDVWSVTGGAQVWICEPATIKGNTDIPELRESPKYEQAAVVFAFFGVKLVYSVMAGVIAWALRKRTEADLAAIRWSMLCFFAGEFFCLINVILYHDQSDVMEHLHSVGMVMALAFGVYAIIEMIDRRVIHFSAGGCRLNDMCGGCDRVSGCALRRFMMLGIVASAISAAIPLFSQFRTLAYNTHVFGAVHSYRHPVIHQLYELRYLPVLAIALLLAGLFVMLTIEKRDVSRAKILVSAGLGAAAFALFRWVLVAPFEQNQVWFAFWEEATELIYIAMMGALLVLFRGLLAERPAPVLAEKVEA